MTDKCTSTEGHNCKHEWELARWPFGSISAVCGCGEFLNEEQAEALLNSHASLTVELSEANRLLLAAAFKYLELVEENASLTEKVDRLEKAFDALHKHRYDSECEECSRIVALLESE